MKQTIKNSIKQNKKILFIITMLRLLFKSKLLKINGAKKLYPKVIQFPITFKCNSKCIMCNVWKMSNKNEISVNELKKFLSDPVFKRVTSVGINGGEPSLVSDLPLFVEAILNLPNIQSINIISNGLIQNLLLSKIKKIYQLCKNEKVGFHLSFSLDGVATVHDSVRGIKNAFNKTIDTIDKVLDSKIDYCDSLDIGCTIVKANVFHLVELDVYSKMKKYPIKYRLAIENKRIESDLSANNYSIFYDKNLKQTAMEFIHSRIAKAQTFTDKFKYFSIFYFLASRKAKRLLGCMWKDEGITLDARGNLYYCAVKSENLGSLRNKDGESIFFDQNNIEHRKSIIKKYCDSCIHDYSGKPNIFNLLIFIKYIIFERLWCKFYRMRLLLWL
ncbi:putative Fe-S oxidoreductase [Candidatus Magnetomoraceae bacterium gMMP-15]